MLHDGRMVQAWLILAWRPRREALGLEVPGLEGGWSYKHEACSARRLGVQLRDLLSLFASCQSSLVARPGPLAIAVEKLSRRSPSLS